MLIYIIHADKYYSFSLPDEVSGNYVISDYDENGFSRNLVNVVAKDNKWVMNSNENVRIISNEQIINNEEQKNNPQMNEIQKIKEIKTVKSNKSKKVKKTIIKSIFN